MDPSTAKKCADDTGPTRGSDQDVENSEDMKGQIIMGRKLNRE